MNMKKKLSILLVLLLLPAFTACGGTEIIYVRGGSSALEDIPVQPSHEQDTEWEQAPAAVPPEPPANSEPDSAPSSAPETEPAPGPEPTSETVSGSNPDQEAPPEPAPEDAPAPVPELSSDPVQRDYVLNTNTMKFHYPGCSSVSDIKDRNREDFTGERDELIAQGYLPCKRCNP